MLSFQFKTASIFNILFFKMQASIQNKKTSQFDFQWERRHRIKPSQDPNILEIGIDYSHNLTLIPFIFRLTY